MAKTVPKAKYTCEELFNQNYSFWWTSFQCKNNAFIGGSTGGIIGGGYNGDNQGGSYYGGSTGDYIGSTGGILGGGKNVD